MATYRNYAELQGKVLQNCDHVIFGHEGIVFGYKVESESLWEINRNHIENEIFRLLGLDPFEFCEKYYGKLPNKWEWRKKTSPNYWPSYCDDDFESITKAVLELFRLIEEPKRLKETSEILFID